MFCPRCGAQGADSQKFCRGCGTDLEPVNVALTGALPMLTDERGRKRFKSTEELWEQIATNFFIGLAFLMVALALAFTGAAGGRNWWFWMLIPAGVMLGRAASAYFALKNARPRRIESNDFTANSQPLFSSNQTAANLPPQRQSFTDYAPPSRVTGELVMPPLSVTENTTRHLRHETENPTALFDAPEKQK